LGRVTSLRRVTRIVGPLVSARPDTLVAEEPLEIRVAGRPLTVTMRTPGQDFDLAAGFLLTEGLVRRADQVAGIRYCAGARDDGANTYNVVDVVLSPGVPTPAPSLERNFYTTSSCGLCGKASLDAVRTTSAWSVRDDSVLVNPAIVAELPDRLRAAQHVFARTGGLHAAGLFAADGQLLCLREDVGRHNAVDKVLGWALRNERLPLRGTLLLVSGRASFELVQKAVMAGIPVLAAVSAPSSLAADLAADAGLTLIGFLRGSSMNVYSAEHRLALVDSKPVGA
jgi:FdhD protein